VVVNYASSKDGAQKVVDTIVRGGGKAIAVQGDVGKEADVRRLFAEVKKQYGRVDVLINNAGVFDFQPLENVTTEHFRRHFDINVLGLLFASQEAARLMGAEGGSIINISSLVSTLAPANSAVYSGTKGAVDTITRVLAKELGPKNIRVNSINPGMVVTEGMVSAGFDKGDFRTHIEKTTPLGRIGQPQDIAGAAVFFASADSAWITGETLNIAGGYR